MNIDKLTRDHAMDDLKRGAGRATFGFGFGWYRFDSTKSMELPQAYPFQLTIEGLKRDPTIWTVAYTRIYAARVSHHNLRDPFFDHSSYTELHPGYTVILEFDDDPDTSYRVVGYSTAWSRRTGNLSLTVTQSVREAYKLKDYDLLR